MKMAKISKKVATRARLLSVPDVPGWLLIAKDADANEWNIAWLDPFSTKKRALDFATANRWSKPYQAVRGRITIQ